MRKVLLIILAIVVIAAAAFWFLTAPDRLAASDLPAHQPDRANGARMFLAGGCASCHAVPGAAPSDQPVLAGGLALKSPVGTFHVPNITPDPADGIGGWSDLDFVNAMTRGVSPGGVHYYPAFPYTSYQHMRLEDVLDLKAFLDTLPAAKSEVPDHDLAFPYNLRRGVGLWKLRYLDPAPLAPDPGATDAVNRGAYLVRAIGHCGECHTPRDAYMGLDETQALAGAPDVDGEGFVPNITPHESGIGDWTEEQIASAFRDGFTPEFDSLGGEMAAVQRNLARLPVEDLAAIAAYLKSVPPLPTVRPE